MNFLKTFGILLCAAVVWMNAEQSKANASGRSTAQTQPPPQPQTTAVPPGINQPNAGPNQPHTGGNQSEPLWPKFVERLIDPVTWFTFFLLIVSFFQWRAMLRQSK